MKLLETRVECKAVCHIILLVYLTLFLKLNIMIVPQVHAQGVKQSVCLSHSCCWQKACGVVGWPTLNQPLPLMTRVIDFQAKPVFVVFDTFVTITHNQLPTLFQIRQFLCPCAQLPKQTYFNINRMMIQCYQKVLFVCWYIYRETVYTHVIHLQM